MTGSMAGGSLHSRATQSYQGDGGYSSSTTNSTQFCCLYTKQKTKKKKLWQDGRLVLRSSKGILHDADPTPGSGDPVLDEVEISQAQKQALIRQTETRLETNLFLIEVEGPWVNPVRNSNHLSMASHSKASASMKKLPKFQKPKPYVPPNPNSRPSRLQIALGKRRRPLQPGELERQHYGMNQPAGVQNMMPQQHRHEMQNPENHSSVRRRESPNAYQTQSRFVEGPQDDPRNFPGHQNSGPVIAHQNQMGNSVDIANPPPPFRHRQEGARYDAPNSFHNVTSSVTTTNNDYERSSTSRRIMHRQTSDTGRAGSQPDALRSDQNFATNNFDASAYYGEEEEEDEDEEHEACAPGNSCRNDNGNEGREDVSIQSKQQIAEPIQTTTTYDTTTKPVSGSQLLALFGAPIDHDSIQEEMSQKLQSSTSGFYLPPSSSQSSSDDDSS